MLAGTYHSFLLAHVGCDEIVQKEEGLGINRHKDMVFEIRDEAAVHCRFLFCQVYSSHESFDYDGSYGFNPVAATYLLAMVEIPLAIVPT